MPHRPIVHSISKPGGGPEGLGAERAPHRGCLRPLPCPTIIINLPNIVTVRSRGQFAIHHPRTRIAGLLPSQEIIPGSYQRTLCDHDQYAAKFKKFPGPPLCAIGLITGSCHHHPCPSPHFAYDIEELPQIRSSTPSRCIILHLRC